MQNCKWRNVFFSLCRESRLARLLGTPHEIPRLQGPWWTSEGEKLQTYNLVKITFYILLIYIFSVFQLNHFPGTFQIGRKDRLWRNLSKMQARYGKQEFSFFPRTFVLPQDIKLLRKAWEDGSPRQKWIIKPVSSAWRYWFCRCLTENQFRSCCVDVWCYKQVKAC